MVYSGNPGNLCSIMNLQETEDRLRRNREAERSRESKEAKEDEKDPELQAAATLERADFLVKEVKTSKRQMQNIVLNIQQVQQQIQALRQQLQLSQTDEPSSIVHDKARVSALRKKIEEHLGELANMREDLIDMEIKDLRKGGAGDLNDTEIRRIATQHIEEILKEY